MRKRTYLIVIFANEIQSISASNVKKVIQYVNIAPIICNSYIFAYTLNDLKKEKKRAWRCRCMNMENQQVICVLIFSWNYSVL